MGSKVAKDTDGFSFDLISQNFVEDGETYVVTGSNSITLGNTNYHGGFSAEHSEIGVAFNISVDDQDYIWLLEGKKN